MSNKKFILLMRHAESDQPLGVPDMDRTLNLRGQQQAQKIGEQIKGLKFSFDHALVSRSTRTKETFDILKPFIGEASTIFDERLYQATADELLQVILDQSFFKTLLLIGHNPAVSELCANLCGHYQSFAPANLAILSTEEISTCSFKLERMLRP